VSVEGMKEGTTEGAVGKQTTPEGRSGYTAKCSQNRAVER
jgi:hypothetical protein